MHQWLGESPWVDPVAFALVFIVSLIVLSIVWEVALIFDFTLPAIFHKAAILAVCGQVVAAESRAVHARRNGRGSLFVRHDHAQRQPASQRFGRHDDVRQHFRLQLASRNQ